MSGVQGINLKATSLGQNVVILSFIILLARFLVLRFGTDKVGFIFASPIFIWFLFIGLTRICNILKYNPRDLKAFNQLLACSVSPGIEAMFADVGHFPIASVWIAFSVLVYPNVSCMHDCLYIGQTSGQMKHPEHVADTFYKSIPVAAAIIANQVMISVTFRIIKQAKAFWLFPKSYSNSHI